MGRCSELAYVQFEADKEQLLRDSLKELGLDFVEGFARDATCAFLARNDRFAVLAFRGTTKDYRTILTDIDIRFRHDKSGARIADGFSKAYALVQDDIAAAVGALSLSLPLYITGHSLGGAIAVSSDIVPRVPFAFGYRQVGDLRYIKRMGGLVENPNSIGPFFSFVWSFVTSFKSVFENHRIAGSVAALHDWAPYRLKLDKHRRAAYDAASGSASSTRQQGLGVSGR